MIKAMIKAKYDDCLENEIMGAWANVASGGKKPTIYIICLYEQVMYL